MHSWKIIFHDNLNPVDIALTSNTYFLCNIYSSNSLLNLLAYREVKIYIYTSSNVVYNHMC